MREQLIRLGVIGLGRAAAQMLPSFTAHGGILIAAAADPNDAARARFENDFGGKTYATGMELSASPDVDAVYVATPHQHHAADTITAASHGKHVLVEKPMALTVAECNLMTGAANRNGVVLVVGHSHGFNPSIKLIRGLIESGDVGPLRMMTNIVYNGFLYRPRRPEELDTARGGGIMYNQVPHQIDMIRVIDGGSIESAYAVTGIWDRKRPTEGAMTALLRFSDGVAATLTYSGYDHFDTDEFHDWISELGNERQPEHGKLRRELRGYADAGDEARGRTAGGFAGQGAIEFAGPMHHPHFGFLLVSCDDADLRPSPDGVLVYSEDGVREVISPAARAYPNKDGAVDEFYDAIVSGTPPLHDGKWGTETMAATLALLKSAKERRVVTIAL